MLPGDETGTIRVDIITTGLSQDSDGYSVLLDGSSSIDADAVDVIFFSDIETGVHTAEVTGVQSNCSVAGDQSQTANVMAADTVTVMFEIVCRRRLVNQLVFASNRTGDFEDFELYIMNADGSDPVALTQNGFINLYPDISPDGTRVLYTRLASLGAEEFQIRVMDADGTNDRAITAVNNSRDHLPAWSPDGTQILFTTDRDGNEEIYRMNADGSNQINVSRSDSIDHTPSWSPDGTQITFVSARDGYLEVYIANTDGTGLIKLTDDTAPKFSPQWSPDGSKIIFNSTVNANNDIYMINSDGTGLVQLTNSPQSDNSPVWSADGTEIAFVTDRDGNTEIYKMRVDGAGLPVNLSAHPAGEYTPSWSPVQE